MIEPFIIDAIVPEDSTPEDSSRVRLDRWLASYLSEASLGDNIDECKPSPLDDAPDFALSLSRSRLKNMILDGAAVVNGVCQRDPSANVRGGDAITLTITPPIAAIPEGQDIPLDILFEDDHIIVINKAAGLVVHPAPGSLDMTLVNALIAHCGDGLKGIGGEKRPGIVHRLDKDTSGVMMAAKTAKAHQVLSEMFAAHDLDRVYNALVWGVPMERQQTVDAPIGRNNRDRKKMAVTEKGREAVTHFNFTRTLPPLASLAECRLETGRTHQIRVHATHIGHSIIGDPHYGRPMRAGQMPDNALRLALAGLREFPRQALHACLLGFNHPITGEVLEFTAPIPPDMQNLLDGLENALKMRGHL